MKSKLGKKQTGIRDRYPSDMVRCCAGSKRHVQAMKLSMAPTCIDEDTHGVSREQPAYGYELSFNAGSTPHRQLRHNCGGFAS